ncbi:5869_t:CDS:2, partial [Gigaspora rosea]
ISTELRIIEINAKYIQNQLWTWNHRNYGWIRLKSALDFTSNPFDWSTRQKEDAYEESTRIFDIFDFLRSFKTYHLYEIFKNSKIAIVVTVLTYLDNVTNQLATIKPYESLELRLDMLDIR